jgi:hypothetical protein
VVIHDYCLWYDPEEVDFDEVQSVGFLLDDDKPEEFWEQVHTLPKK